MARVHIDSQFFGEPRHRLLESLVQGKPTMADYIKSRLLDIYHHCYAQMSPVLQNKLVDQITGEIGFCNHLVTAGLADAVSDTEVRIKGIESRTSKLAEKISKRQEAGRRSAEVRKSKYGTSQPNTSRTQPEHVPNICSNKPEQKGTNSNDGDVDVYVDGDVIKYPDLRSGSCGGPESFTEVVSKGVALFHQEEKKRVRKESKDPAPGSRVWDAYCESMRQHWNMSHIPRNAKVMTCAKRLVDLVGEARAIELAKYYPTRRKQFYINSGHKFELLLTDYMALHRELDAGIKLTKEVVREIVQREETENFVRFEETKVVKNPILMDDDEFEKYQSLKSSDSEIAPLLAASNVEDIDVPHTPIPFNVAGSKRQTRGL